MSRVAAAIGRWLYGRITPDRARRRFHGRTGNRYLLAGFETLDDRAMLSVSLVPTASGFVAEFDEDLDPSDLNLYDVRVDGQGKFGPPDVSLVRDLPDGSTENIVGSLVVRDRSVAFVATGGPLDAGDYSVTLRSADDGFKHSDGGLLDGDDDGSAGGDFVDQFVIGAVEPVGISLPDFARGPGQSVHVPANDTGLPLTFEDNRSGGNAVESISLTISYDSRLLNIVDATLGPDAPADSVLSVNTDTPGQVALSLITQTTTLGRGSLSLISLTAGVPWTADYCDSGVLTFSEIQVTDSDDSPVAVTADESIHVAAYFGDTTGNGADYPVDDPYSGLDAQRAGRVSVGLDGGFEAYPTIDPLVIGDVTRNGEISGFDAHIIAREVVRLDPWEIPPLPRMPTKTQLAVLNDENPQIYFVDPVSGALTGTIDIGTSTAMALAADDANQTFYYGGKGSLRRVSYDGTGDSLIGEYFGDQTGILGMGFNPLNDTLYGYRAGSLFSIDTATAELTLVAEYGDGLGIQGLDVDPHTGRIFAADEASSQILELHTDGTYDVLFSYPAGRTDVDGLAAAQGRIYTVEDDAGEPITVLNLSDGSVLGTLPLPYVVDGSNAGGAIFTPAPEPSTLVAWGSDGHGQVSGTPAGSDFIAISGSESYSLALRSDGSLAIWGDAWGDDDYGLISGMPDGADFTAIAAGRTHGFALRSDGSLVSWGSDGHGQISGTPVGSDFIAIAAGWEYSLALRSNGSLVAWGWDNLGQVSETPVGSDFTAIAAGASSALALRSNGSLVAWGDDGDGRVSGTPDGTEFTAIAMGQTNGHNLALKSDGSLVSWGRDDLGQVSDTPSGTDFAAIAVGGYHSLALKSDGSLVGWGAENGLTDIPSGTGFTAIACGRNHSLALTPVPIPPPS